MHRLLAECRLSGRTPWVAADRRAAALLAGLRSSDTADLTLALQFAVDPLRALLPRSGRMFMVISSAVTSSLVAASVPNLCLLMWKAACAAAAGENFDTLVLLFGTSRRQCAPLHGRPGAANGRRAASSCFVVAGWQRSRRDVDPGGSVRSPAALAGLPMRGLFASGSHG